MSIPLTIVLPIVLTVFWLDSDHRAATETPGYKVIRTEANFDLRHYPTQTIATTATPLRDDETNATFEQLFRYITDRNDTSEEIERASPLIDTARDNKVMRFGSSCTTQIEHGSTGPRHGLLARQTPTGRATLRTPTRSTLDAGMPASQHTDDSNCRTA